MAVSDHNGYCPKSLFNPIYEQVRISGLYYEIKEYPGSTFIKISTNKNIYYRQREKFRFRNTRTFNGASTLNWRKSETFHETTTFSQNSSAKFPDFSFFQNTPAPTPAPRLCGTMPRPTTSTPLAPPPTSPTQCATQLAQPPPSLTPSSLPSPLCGSLNSPILPPPSPLPNPNPPNLPPPNLPNTNPYRSVKRKSTISPVYSFTVPSVLSSSNGSNDSSATENEPPDEKYLSPEDIEALKNMMKALYERTKF